MLFEFFKKHSDPLEDQNKDIIAKISYCMFSNSKYPIVDVELKEYDDECIKGLCDILNILASETSLAETIEIIKDAMINDNQENQLIKLFNHLSKNTKSKILNSYNDDFYDQPCIKPSDVFLGK